jgi:hypothetical protein
MGRKWLTKKLDDFLKGKKSRLFLIYGDPGVGKSAFLANFVKKYREDEECDYKIIDHFCQWKIDKTLDPYRFIQSLSHQLAATFPEYRINIDDNVKDAKSQDPYSLFEKLVIEPVATIRPACTIAIFVDSLDEALNHGSYNIVTLLRDILDNEYKLPPCFKFIVSSRKIEEIIDRLKEYEIYEINADYKENKEDAEAYIKYKIGKLNADTKVNIDAIVRGIESKSEFNSFKSKRVCYSPNQIRGGFSQNDKIGIIEIICCCCMICHITTGIFCINIPKCITICRVHTSVFSAIEDSDRFAYLHYIHIPGTPIVDNGLISKTGNLIFVK